MNTKTEFVNIEQWLKSQESDTTTDTALTDGETDGAPLLTGRTPLRGEKADGRQRKHCRRSFFRVFLSVYELLFVIL